MTGNIHSIETMGLVDGPGIRTVVFLKGCPLKCAYCHNPDTQNCGGGKSYTVSELVNFIKRYKRYYDVSGGGVTFSGGEPLLQSAFLIEAIKALKAEGIHVALDTSGYGDESYYKALLPLVDLVLLDIKHYDDLAHKKLVGKSMNGLLKFLSYLEEHKVKLWLRHVMVPGLTDSKESMDQLFHHIEKYAKLVEKIEILPYHKLGVEKYTQLGMVDPMADIPEMDTEAAKFYESYIRGLLEDSKSQDRKTISRRSAV
ncbi:MAG: pyruvate formate lyase-activating protein [Clostridia bacterium]|nr:pyruvate formate lyase-activating protein [Clostridia bacterium]